MRLRGSIGRNQYLFIFFKIWNDPATFTKSEDLGPWRVIK